MSDEPATIPEQERSRPWGAKGTTGPVFAGNVSFEDVSFSIRNKPILNNISIELQAGRIACLLGPSGCGKSTLLRLAAGVASPTSGRILLDGQEVAGPHRFVPPEKRNIGLMFQDFALFPHMTALQNVAYGLYALKRQEAEAVASRALERVGLSAMMHRYPAMLSGGEQQRVALARAIVPRPQVILMDEPFSGLDQRLRESVRTETFMLLRETRATCLLVTHDPHEAFAVADHIFLLRSGHLVQQGSPEQLISNPVDAAAARFFMHHNKFNNRVEYGRVATPFGAVPAPNLKDGQQALVLLPPSAILLSKDGHGTAARLVESRFMGDHRHYYFTIDGHEDRIEVYGDLDDAVSPGEDCRLVVSPNRAHVFAVEESAD
jgi:iron(III) transport system ATP-binding protein